MQRIAGLVLLAAALAACGGGAMRPSRPTPPLRPTAAAVDAARLIAADAEPGQWLATGRTYDEQRFSPLDQIDASNVGELGLAWYADFDTAARRNRRRSSSTACCT